VEIPRPAVVAKTRPGSFDVFHRRQRQRGEVGKPGQENRVAFGDPPASGLLQHDFRNQNLVRILGPAPGKVAPVAVVPGEQRSPEAAWIDRLQHGALTKSPQRQGESASPRRNSRQQASPSPRSRTPSRSRTHLTPGGPSRRRSRRHCRVGTTKRTYCSLVRAPEPLIVFVLRPNRRSPLRDRPSPVQPQDRRSHSSGCPRIFHIVRKTRGKPLQPRKLTI